MFRTSGSYSHECMRDASVHERMGSIASSIAASRRLATRADARVSAE